MASVVAMASCDDVGSREVSFRNAVKDRIDDVKKAVDALESDSKGAAFEFVLFLFVTRTQRVRRVGPLAT
jgi:hypothetical protein